MLCAKWHGSDAASCNDLLLCRVMCGRAFSRALYGFRYRRTVLSRRCLRAFSTVVPVDSQFTWIKR